MVDQIVLSEAQILDFDKFYINQAEFERLRETFAHYPEDLRMADFGGGNGTFCDLLLNAFPKAHVTNIDISKALLERNTPHPNKELVHGSFLDHTPPAPFDVICLNYVLHHLVSDSIVKSRSLIQQAVQKCFDVLSETGTLVIFENILVGLFADKLASSLLYKGTSSRTLAWFTRRMGANTAGIGVYYMGYHELVAFVENAGFRIVDEIEVRPRNQNLNLYPTLAKAVRRVGFVIRKS